VVKVPVTVIHTKVHEPEKDCPTCHGKGLGTMYCACQIEFLPAVEEVQEFKVTKK